MDISRLPLLNLLNQDLLRQMWRFGITGGLAFILHFSLLILLTEGLGFHYLISTTLAFLVSVSFSYVLSVRWIFRFSKQHRSHLIVSLIFLILAVFGLCINNIIMFIGVAFCDLHYTLTQIIATSLVMFFNFITRKKLIE